jgi:SulP family sulfate permease
MKKIGDMTSKHSEVKKLKKEKYWADELNIPKEILDKVYIKHIKGPVFFGSTTDFSNLAGEIPDYAETVIFRLGRMPYVDQSGLYAFEDLLVRLNNDNKDVIFVDILEQPRYMFERIDIIPDLVNEDHIFENITECVKFLSSKH